MRFQNNVARRLSLILLFCLTTMLFSACGSETEEAGYDIYCISADGTKIEAEKWASEGSTDSNEVIRELLKQLAAAPESHDLKAALPDDTTVVSGSLDTDSDQISVFLTESYKTMSGSRETLASACVVKTLLGAVPEAQSVMFYVGTDPLTDATGRAIGQMTRDTFVGDFGKDQAELQNRDLTIYYANESGEMLVPLPRNVHYSSNTNIESLVIENLTVDPAGTEARAVFTDPSEVLHISTTDGICYVDLDNNYFTQAANVTENVAIYSLVDSLCEIDSVNKVQITVYVNGKPVTGEGTYSGLYEPNTDLIASDDGDADSAPAGGDTANPSDSN